MAAAHAIMMTIIVFVSIFSYLTVPFCPFFTPEPIPAADSSRICARAPCRYFLVL